MAASSISESVSTSTRALSASPFVLFQRGGPQVLAMYQCSPATSAWNGNELAEYFIYEGEVRPATAQPQTMEDESKKED